MQKRGLISAGPAKDTWHAELMWCAGPAWMRRGTQGYVAEPHESTQREGGPQVVRTRGRDHTSPRGRPGGATWHEGGGWQVEGPRVSEPWLGVWGSNANAFSRPSFYTHSFPFFLLRGTMFPRVFNVQDTWQHYGRWMRIASRKAHRLSGPESTQSSSRARAQMGAVDRVSEHWTALIKS